jgi:hypothetical protein
VLACMRSMDKVLTKHLLMRGGLPTPDFFAFSEIAFRELGRGGCPAGDRGAARISTRREARGAGLGARDQVRRIGRRRARGARVRVQLRRPRAARAPREGPRAGVSLLEDDARSGAADRRGQAQAGVLLDFEARTRSARPTTSVRRRPEEVTARAQDLAVSRRPAARGATASRAST